MPRFLPGLVLALLTVLTAAPGHAAPVNTGHLSAELVPQTQGVAPGGTVYVALRQKIDKGWHTYWRNSGDSGEATQIAWTLPAGASAGDIVWAPPHRQPTGPLMNYGYTGEVLLPVAITAPAGAKPGQTIDLKADVAFLVCADICVPEDATLTLALPVTAGPPPKDPKWGAPVDAALAAAPRPAAITAAFAVQDGALKLAATGAPLSGIDAADAYFYPYSGTVIDHAKPQAIERGPQGLTLTIVPGYAFEHDQAPPTLAGVLEAGGKAYEIEAQPGPAPAGAAGLGPPPAPAPKAASLGLPLAALFAFLGGLILNLMPCVFPVLAMKAASLAGHGDEHSAARRQGLVFLAGCLATFLALAGGLIALKAAGAAVGWGFQLQSPPVVAVLALLMLVVALDLSGVFEVGTSAQSLGAGLASRRGLIGAFFTGALAVVVAAPCTAPFMAPALGWAFTQTPLAALTVFAALGLGFGAPFTALAFIPALISRMPRPGPWMDGFRKLLAFPMYGAAAWLVWVLSQQTDPAGLARILAASVVVAFAAWLAGIAQRRQASGARALPAGVAALVFAALGLGSVVWPAYDAASAAEPGASPASAEVPYEPYTPQRLAELRAEGKPVFVDYTAAWCVTCQVNEKVALSTEGVAEAFKRTGAVYLKADWTRKDADIAAELAQHGRAGVPLYLLYAAGGGEPKVLPQLLTPGLVARALDKAAAKKG